MYILQWRIAAPQDTPENETGIPHEVLHESLSWILSLPIRWRVNKTDKTKQEKYIQHNQQPMQSIKQTYRAVS